MKFLIFKGSIAFNRSNVLRLYSTNHQKYILQCTDCRPTEASNEVTVKVVIFARVIFRASAIFDIFACF